MRKALVLVLLCLTVFSLTCGLSANAQTFQTIRINANGEVSPSTAAIQKVGNTYTLTANLSGSLIVEANNILIDGANHTLQGPSVNINCIAVNLTAANVTVENMRITNWKVGVLSAWNNNTITNNQFTNNSQGIAIYSDDNVIRQNNILNCSTGIFIDGGFRTQGDNNLITQNKITSNHAAFDVYNNNGVTITANNIENNEVVLILATNTAKTVFYYNNFENNGQALEIPWGGPDVEGNVPFSPAGQWDNSTVGNYWSDYTTKYPGATEIDHTGIGTSSYAIESTLSYSESRSGTDITGVAVLGTAIDNHPLIAPISPSMSTGPLPTASPTVPEYPVWIIFVALLAAVCLVTLLSVKHQLKIKMGANATTHDV